MTANQINYQRLVEDRRHNRALEVESQRHNVVTEGQGNISIAEQRRHNVAAEGVNWYTAEKSAENAAAGVQVNAERNQIQSDFNTAVTTETNRHNVESEKSDKVNALSRAVSAIIPNFLSLGSLVS